jgi:methionine sulfoxide reductase heme-binding subunit
VLPRRTGTNAPCRTLPVCVTLCPLHASNLETIVLMDITVLDLSAYIGLIAVGAVTINMLLGTLMVFRYSPVRQWPHRRFNYFGLHNFSGYLSLSLAVLHPIVLLFNKTTRFRVMDLVYPVHSPSQPLENTIGAIALYAVAIVVITSYFRIRLGRRKWKSFHFVIYVAAVALFWHSLFTDPDLKRSPVDWLDGGKLFVEACVLVIAVVAAVRWRYAPRHN